MRCLKRNEQTLYYALYLGKTELIDEYGNATGQFEKTFSEPIRCRMNVSSARGVAELEQFGVDTKYTKTLVTDDMSCPIDENTVLWIDRTPTTQIDGDTVVNPHNYIVSQVARSLNSITFAVKEVDVE